MDKLAGYLARYILAHDVIKEEDYAIYKYGFQTGIELLSCITTIIIIACYMGNVRECIFIMAIFLYKGCI